MPLQFIHCNLKLFIRMSFFKDLCLRFNSIEPIGTNQTYIASLFAFIVIFFCMAKMRKIVDNNKVLPFSTLSLYFCVGFFCIVVSIHMLSI